MTSARCMISIFWGSIVIFFSSLSRKGGARCFSSLGEDSGMTALVKTWGISIHITIHIILEISILEEFFRGVQGCSLTLGEEPHWEWNIVSTTSPNRLKLTEDWIHTPFFLGSPFRSRDKPENGIGQGNCFNKRGWRKRWNLTLCSETITIEIKCKFKASRIVS